MGKKQKPQVVYLPPPNYQSAPGPSEADIAAQNSAQAQLLKMQESYNAQMQGLQKQFEVNSNTSNSVIQTLQAALAQQQAATAANAGTLDQAKAASQSQLDLLAQQRDAVTAQLGDQRVAQAGMTGSVFNRLSKRKAARQLQY
jgi:multidrug resistance efflux pump